MCSSSISYMFSSIYVLAVASLLISIADLLYKSNILTLSYTLPCHYHPSKSCHDRTLFILHFRLYNFADHLHSHTATLHLDGCLDWITVAVMVFCKTFPISIQDLRSSNRLIIMILVTSLTKGLLLLRLAI